jgi:hypothetical protein
MESSSEYWRKCNICKKLVHYASVYWVCNVSTCNRKRTGLHFCSVECWDAHLPGMNHREAWAIEKRAPTQAEWEKSLQEESKPRAQSSKRSLSPEKDPPKPSEGIREGSAPVIRRRARES